MRVLLKKLNEAVSIIDTEALGSPGVVAAYLVAGTETALIDMGYQSSADIIIEDLRKQKIGPEDLDYLLPTHVHLDHCGSCGTLARRFSSAIIRVHPKGEPHLSDPTQIWDGATRLFGKDLMSKYGHPEPVDRKRLHSAGEGDVIDLGRGVAIRVRWTPGHASHHLSYEWESHRAFFTGDAVGIHFPSFATLIPTTPPTSFDMDKALRSLEIMKAYSPRELYTPHYGIVGNAVQWIDENIGLLRVWKQRIEEMKGAGLPNERIIETVVDETCAKVGRPVRDLPDYVRVSIRISVLGFLRYLGR